MSGATVEVPENNVHCQVKSECRDGQLVVPTVLRDVRLHLARTPPCSILDVLHYGRRWGLSRWRPFSLLHMTAWPATKAPVTALLLSGSSLHGSSQCENRPTLHVPQPLLHVVRRVRASLALTDCEVAVLTEQARGGVRQV